MVRGRQGWRVAPLGSCLVLTTWASRCSRRPGVLAVRGRRMLRHSGYRRSKPLVTVDASATGDGRG